ncbi:hypothetical protein CVV65_08140 [Kyrpidia spormannii]|uniref:Uncharacterized protein n=1 Tax=Kyrpidia spormannii TaxID=2055160 RepID=A0A2K8N728_9BACL|nr:MULTISPECIES: DUF269 domain-containing protein [Kyrpidia]ATY84895.1 hypothetical protein CVV65_08140 [Kyrpidia spormannii]MCL6574619.1 DUF269 domain-containing protein [Kyrpidia sp.]CAB3393128.1 conserved protein of unknown function [Kyrpidia spormannii]
MAVVREQRGSFVTELARLVRARDTYGVLDGKPDADILQDYVRKGGKRDLMAELALETTDAVRQRVHLFYEAVASRLERLIENGQVINVAMELDPEGFGQVVLYTDWFVVWSEGLRDVPRRYLFDNLDQLEALGQSIVKEGLARWETCSKIAHLLPS